MPGNHPAEAAQFSSAVDNRTQIGAVQLATTSLVASIQPVVAALVWTGSLRSTMEGSLPRNRPPNGCSWASRSLHGVHGTFNDAIAPLVHHDRRRPAAAQAWGPVGRPRRTLNGARKPVRRTDSWIASVEGTSGVSPISTHRDFYPFGQSRGTDSPMSSSYSSRLMRPGLLFIVVLAWVLATPVTAWAHGIGPASHLSAWGFIPLGIEHMLLGWDHLLFIAGILLVARTPRVAAKIITVFVLGHSTTLILATLAGWRLNPTLVDVVIGLSIAYVAVAVIQRVRPNRRFTVVIAIFGLIHGLGLATRLQDLGLPDDGVLGKVVAFNVGLEIGQLIAISLMVLLSTLVLRLWKGRTRESATVLTRRLGLGLVAGSALAVTTVVYGGLTEDDAPTATLTAAEAAEAAEATEKTADAATGSDGPPAPTCTEGPMRLEFPGGGGHAQKPFFGPDEDAPMADVGHSLADGYVALLYRADLPEADVETLRGLVEDDPLGGTLAAAVPGQASPVVAVTGQKTLTCSAVDAAALSAFTTGWLEAQQG